MLYLNFVPSYELGVRKKIFYQIKVLKKKFNNVVCTEIKDNYFFLNGEKKIRYEEKNFLFFKIIRKLEYIVILLYLLKKKDIYTNIDFIYLRYEKTDPFMLSYFKFLKKIGKKIILELPTYPYDGEIRKENIWTILDKIYRKKLYKYVYKIITYEESKFIWGISCINIQNGVDLQEIVKLKKINHNTINFVAVARISFWHNFGRFIYSLKKFYDENNKQKIIIFNIIGDGHKDEMEKLKKMVKDFYLDKYVFFHGYKSGKELDDLYNISDIAIGSLGEYIRGIYKSSNLKNREYCAKGIPFILGVEDDSFKNCDFVFRVPNDDSLIDIEKIIEWYNNLTITSNEIRKYAEENLTWDIQMKKVIDNI